MPKFDFKKDLKQLYNPPVAEVVMADVPAMNFLMIDGAGDPNTSPGYQETLNALYNVAYTLKFMLKKGENPMEYTVPPLEGLWWADDMAEFSTARKGDWKWTMMIMQPQPVTLDRVQAALAEIHRKKGESPALSRLRFESFAEGLCAQVMHIGPYSAEGPTIERLHSFIRQQGYTFNGEHQKHHEIYLSDPRRAAPEKMRTVLRQPAKRN